MPETGTLIERRQLLIGLGAIGTFGFSEWYTPRRSAPTLTSQQFEATFPKQIGPWHYESASGLILPPQDQLSMTLYEQLTTRIYDADKLDAVMMLLAYSSKQEGRLQVHRPEACYPAAGFQIISNDPWAIPLGAGAAVTGRYLVADRSDRRECIFYWVRVGSRMPVRWFEQRAAMAEANVAGYIPDGLLGRVSLVSNDAVSAKSTLTRFVQALIASVGSNGRRLLLTGQSIRANSDQSGS